MTEWCHVCSRYGPCVHTENQAQWRTVSIQLEREAAERAKEHARNLTSLQALEAKWEAEKKSPPPDSPEYWKQIHEDANRARRAAGYLNEPGRKFGKIPEKPPPDPELRSDAGWRQPIEPPQPKPRKLRPRRDPDSWEILSSFKVGTSRILVPAPKSAEVIAKAAAKYKPTRVDEQGFQAFMILESQQQSNFTALAEVALNRIVESRWPTLEFSDLKPISVPFGRRGRKLEPPL